MEGGGLQGWPLKMWAMDGRGTGLLWPSVQAPGPAWAAGSCWRSAPPLWTTRTFLPARQTDPRASAWWCDANHLGGDITFNYTVIYKVLFCWNKSTARPIWTANSCTKFNMQVLSSDWADGCSLEPSGARSEIATFALNTWAYSEAWTGFSYSRQLVAVRLCVYLSWWKTPWSICLPRSACEELYPAARWSALCDLQEGRQTQLTKRQDKQNKHRNERSTEPYML